jgi:hypothetical protein
MSVLLALPAQKNGHLVLGGLAMPIEDSDPKVRAREKRAVKKADKKAAMAVQFGGFINANPNEADKLAFEAWLQQENEFIESWQEACENGYKFTVTYETNGDYYRATAATWVPGDANAGLVLSLRASDPVKALQRVVWWLVWKSAYRLQAPTSRKYDGDAW